jgi:hypothetical protein
MGSWILFIYRAMHADFAAVCCMGLYIGKYPPSGGGGISANGIWGKICKGEEKKGENVKEKEEREKKGRKGKENDKRGSKRVK